MAIPIRKIVSVECPPCVNCVRLQEELGRVTRRLARAERVLAGAAAVIEEDVLRLHIELRRYAAAGELI